MSNEQIVKNAVHCRICGSAADKHPNMYICQKNPNHIGDLIVGILTDCTYREAKTEANTSQTPCSCESKNGIADSAG